MPADPVRPPSGIDRKMRWLPGLLALLLTPLVLTWVPAPTVRGPGPVLDLSRAVAAGMPGGPALGGGRFLLTSVHEEHDPLWLWATRSLLQPTGRSPGAAAGPLNTPAQMQEAMAYAWEVAVDLAVSPVNRDTMVGFADSAPAEPMPAVDTKGLTGPSGGLMLALAFTDRLNQGDLTGGRRIAGTGTIDWDGTVGEIGFVAYKVRGAALAGATVFFVPRGNVDEARRAAPANLHVVAVSTFVDALRWLCHHGTADSVCAKLSARGSV
jgi:hypothetical protein